MNVYSLGTQMSSPFPLSEKESGVCLSLQYTVHQHFLIALSGGDEKEDGYYSRRMEKTSYGCLPHPPHQ